jgi:hypothetical protein
MHMCLINRLSSAHVGRGIQTIVKWSDVACLLDQYFCVAVVSTGY